MKRKLRTLKEILGFSQDDLALVLRVSRNQLSRFELGTGDLPSAAKNLLAELLRYMQAPEAKAAVPDAVSRQYYGLGDYFTRLLKENEYHLERVKRKVVKMEHSYNCNVKALKSLDFIAVQGKEIFNVHPDILRSIGNKAVTIMKEQGLALVLKLKLQLELLELEKILLDSEMRKLSQIPELAGGKY